MDPKPTALDAVQCPPVADQHSTRCARSALNFCALCRAGSAQGLISGWTRKPAPLKPRAGAAPESQNREGNEAPEFLGGGLYNGVSMSAPQGTPMADLSSLKIHDRARKTSNRGKRLGWLAAGLFVLLAGGAAAYRFKDPK